MITHFLYHDYLVDMWSLGCIAAELFTSKVLFKGSDDVDQVKCILSVIGLPDDQTLSRIGSKIIRSELFCDYYYLI